MDSYKYSGVVIAIATIVFSLLALATFFWRIYVMYHGNEGQPADEVETVTTQSSKTTGRSNPTNLQT